MSNIVKNWTDWLNNTRFYSLSEEQKQQTFAWLLSVRDKILTIADIKKDEIILDVGTGTGLLAFGAYELLGGTGLVIASDKFSDCVYECQQIAKLSKIEKGFQTLVTPAEKIDLPDNYADKIVMRSVLVHILDKQTCIDEFYRVLKPSGKVVLFEPIMSSNTKYYDLIAPDLITNFDKFKEIEYEITHKNDDPITNFDENTLKEMFEKSGFSQVDVQIEVVKSTYVAKADVIPNWFDAKPSPGALSLKDKFLKYVTEEEFNLYLSEIQNALSEKELTIKTNSVYITAQK